MGSSLAVVLLTHLELLSRQVLVIFVELIPGSVGVHTGPFALRLTPEHSE